MLRGNLATRPFYNERLVSLLLVLLGVIVLALTVTNVTRLLQLSSRRSELRSQIAADEAAAERIRQGAAAIQKGVDRTTLASLAVSAREANVLIDERTFSWTTLLSLVETTIPMGVRLTSITPQFRDGNIILTMMLVGRRAEDVTDFINALEKTGSFYDVGLATVNTSEENFDIVTMRASYLPPAGVKTAKSDGDAR